MIAKVGRHLSMLAEKKDLTKEEISLGLDLVDEEKVEVIPGLVSVEDGKHCDAEVIFPTCLKLCPQTVEKNESMSGNGDVVKKSPKNHIQHVRKKEQGQ